MIYAFQMETSVSSDYGTRVHNYSLAQKQTITLVFGGIIFLAGTIRTLTIKKRDEDDDNDDERMEEVKEGIEESLQYVKGEFNSSKEKADSFGRSIFKKLKPPEDFQSTRVLVGLSVGFLFMIPAFFVIYFFSIIAPIGCLMLANREIRVDKALKPLLFCLSIALVFPLSALFSVFYEGVNNPEIYLFIGIGLVLVVICVLPIIFYWHLRRTVLKIESND